MSTQVELSFISQNDTRKGHGLTSTIKNLPGDTMLLVSDQERASELTNIAHLTERLDYKEGRDDSMCNVWFADVKIDATDGTTLAMQPIAIKPLGKAWLAAREFRTAKRLNRDAQRTFRSLGFLSMGGQIATVTEFEEGVTSFDNILWRRRQLQEEEIHWALSCAAEGLISLHSEGYTHGDYQVKNTAYSSTLQPRIIDITDVRKRADPFEFGDDLTLYIESLSIFGRRPSKASSQQVKEAFLDPYYQAIHDIFPKSKQQSMQEILTHLAVNADKIMQGEY